MLIGYFVGIWPGEQAFFVGRLLCFMLNFRGRTYIGTKHFTPGELIVFAELFSLLCHFSGAVGSF